MAADLIERPWGMMSVEPSRLFVIGLDLSITGSGIVGASAEEIRECVDPPIMECFGTESKSVWPEHTADLTGRIMATTLRVRAAVGAAQMNGFDPVVFIEGYAMGYARPRKGKAKAATIPPGRLFDLGELGGTVKSYLYQDHVPVFVVTPSQLKKFAADNGNAAKDSVGRSVKNKWNFKTKDDNICDAYVLCRIGFAYFGIVPATTEKQLETIATLQTEYK